MQARPILTVALILVALVMVAPAPAAERKPHTETKRVTRNDRDNNRRVELERRVTTQKGQPTRNVYDRTVSRTTRLSGGRQQTVTLNKTFVNQDDQRKSVDFDRSVEIRKAPQPTPRPSYSHHYWSSPPRYSPPPVYRRSYYPPTRTYYSHDRDHYDHRSGYSFGLSLRSDNLSGSIYYSRGYSPCQRCGAGYYNRIWVEPVYVICYDSCGRPYSKLVRNGYFHSVWVSHRHPCSGW
ncbi:MAG: hypothetical protein IT445_07915 [Phycisphaeraceae bacterium]|nr:hypothetical protein [Phycisphaeraceae bacterium]